MSESSSGNLIIAELLAETLDGSRADHIGFNRSSSGMAVVTLARPDKLDPLSLASWKRLASIFAELQSDEAV